MTDAAQTKPATGTQGFAGLLRRFLQLGLVGFGGPTAHLALFHEQFVVRTQQVPAQTYARMVALSQAIPGPGSSQVGMMIGMHLGGVPGLLAAFLGFTLPSAVVMVALGLGADPISALLGTAGGVTLGVAVFAIVARALAGMVDGLAPDATRKGLALLAFLTVLFVPLPTVVAQVAVLGLAAIVGAVWLRQDAPGPRLAQLEGPRLAQLEGPRLARWVAPLCLGLLAVLLVLILVPWPGLPPEVAAMLGFLRAGGLVFGGGHVVLPVIQADPALVAGIDAARLTTGYAAAQAVPGPVFTFAGFVGAAGDSLGGVLGGLLGLGLIFLPSVLMVLALAPLARLSASARVQGALAAINAAVCGILAAALVNPIALAVIGPAASPLAQTGRLGLLLAATILVFAVRVPGWAMVLVAAGAAAVLTALR